MTARANGEGHGEPRIRKPAQPGLSRGPPASPGRRPGAPVSLLPPPVPSGPLRSPRPRARHRPRASSDTPGSAHTPRGCVLASGTANPPPFPPQKAHKKRRIGILKGKKNDFSGGGGGWRVSLAAPGAAEPPLRGRGCGSCPAKVIREGTASPERGRDGLGSLGIDKKFIS